MWHDVKFCCFEAILVLTQKGPEAGIRLLEHWRRRWAGPPKGHQYGCFGLAPVREVSCGLMASAARAYTYRHHSQGHGLATWCDGACSDTIHIHIASEQQNRLQRQCMGTMAWFNRTPQEPFFGCSQFPSKHAWATHLPVLTRLMLRVKPRSVGSWRGRPVQALAGREHLLLSSIWAMLRTRSRYGAAEEPAAAEPGSVTTSRRRVLTTHCWCPPQRVDDEPEPSPTRSTPTAGATINHQQTPIACQQRAHRARQKYQPAHNTRIRMRIKDKRTSHQQLTRHSNHAPVPPGEFQVRIDDNHQKVPQRSNQRRINVYQHPRHRTGRSIQKYAEGIRVG